MKKIAVIGGYDKTDILIYISKLMSVLNSKVLLVDTTLTQKSRYIVPTMSYTLRYITTYDSIDVAIGFNDEEELKKYAGIDVYMKYDYIIFDIDDYKYYESFNITTESVHCFLTTFDLYSIKKRINVLSNFKEKTPVLKVLVTRDPSSEESSYIDFISSTYKVEWQEEIVYIPFETSDLYEIYKNQRFSKIKLSGLSREFINSLIELIEYITPYNNRDIKKALKIIEKEN